MWQSFYQNYHKLQVQWESYCRKMYNGTGKNIIRNNLRMSKAVIFRSVSSIFWCFKANYNSSGCMKFWIRSCIITRRKTCGVCIKVTYKCREELCNYWKRITSSPVWFIPFHQYVYRNKTFTESDYKPLGIINKP